MANSAIQWSGEMIEGHLVTFAENGSRILTFARENGKLVARTQGGMWIESSYSRDPSSLSAWMQTIASQWFS